VNDANELSDFFNSLDAAPRFQRRAENIPGDFRTAWRVTVLCLLLRHCRADSAPVGQLHTLWWAIRSARSRDLFLRWYEGEKSPDELLVRFDPSVDVTIDLAVGAGLVVREASGAIKLADPGRNLADRVGAEDGVLTEEKRFLSSMTRRITQRQIRDLLEWA
jgi:hypothetical protein